MDHRLVFAPARPAACAFAVAAATTMLTALIGNGAFAQTPPAPKAQPAPKAAPKAATGARTPTGTQTCNLVPGMWLECGGRGARTSGSLRTR